jgi:hypothetical protein
VDVTAGHGRPHAGNENAFAESLFATMKSRAISPAVFETTEYAELFCANFVTRYDKEHLHCALDVSRRMTYVLAGSMRSMRVAMRCSKCIAHAFRNGTILGKRSPALTISLNSNTVFL